MKFKLDENIGRRAVDVFIRAGHDAHTVYDERLQGCNDQTIYERCCEEQRCLVTLDLDFSNILRFPAERCGGIVIIRTPNNTSLTALEKLIRDFLGMVTADTRINTNWIVEPGRIRIHATDDE